MIYRAERHKLTEHQYRILADNTDWGLNDVPREKWGELPDWMTENCLGIVASGSLSDPKMLNGLMAVGGIDWLRAETNPRDKEPEGNASHYVITCSGDQYYLHGPFRSESLVPHWFIADDLDKYESEDP